MTYESGILRGRAVAREQFALDAQRVGHDEAYMQHLRFAHLYLKQAEKLVGFVGLETNLNPVKLLPAHRRE